MPRHRIVKPHDIPLSPPQSLPASGGPSLVPSVTFAAPVTAGLGAPYGLTVTPGPIALSAVTPSAYLDVAWQMPPSALAIEYYDVEYADSADMANAQRVRAATTSARLTFPVNQTKYVRVRAVIGAQVGEWSNVASGTTAADTTPIAGLTAGTTSATFANNGDLVIVAPMTDTSRVRAVRVRIYASNGGALLDELETATGGLVWTAARNLAQTGGVGDASVYVELAQVGWNGSIGATTAHTATSAAPANVSGVTHTWTGDTGLAAASVVFSWTAVAGATYRLTIDGVTYTTSDTRFEYTEALNRQAHAGTLDPSLSYGIVATNGINQQSATPTTGTATNAAPPQPTVAMTATPTALTVTTSGTRPADLQHWQITINRDGTPGTPQVTTSAISIWPVSLTGSYSVTVSSVDVFGQSSSPLTSAAIAVEALSIDELRKGTAYTDTKGTSAAALNILKDGKTDAWIIYP